MGFPGLEKRTFNQNDGKLWVTLYDLNAFRSSDFLEWLRSTG
jgi:hypothetical protein